MWPNPQETADLVTFTEKIFNGKLRFLCNVAARSKWTKQNIILPKETIFRKYVLIDSFLVIFFPKFHFLLFFTNKDKTILQTILNCNGNLQRKASWFEVCAYESQILVKLL